SSSRESVVLPAPEGEDRTSMRPRRATTAPLRWSFSAGIASFQILDLLAELLDHALELEPDIGELDVVRFGAERIGLAVELLSEEIEPPTDRAAVGDQPRGLGYMRRQPV